MKQFKEMLLFLTFLFPQFCYLQTPCSPPLSVDYTVVYSNVGSSPITCHETLGDIQAVGECFITLSSAVSGGSGNYSINWRIHNTNKTIYNVDPLEYICVYGGPYTWTITVTMFAIDVTNQCTTSITKTFNSYCDSPPLKRQIEDKYDSIIELDFSLSDILNTENKTNPIKNIVIYNLNGMIVKNINDKMILDDTKYIENNPIINSLSAGFYIFNFIRYDGTTFAKKFIKN